MKKIILSTLVTLLLATSSLAAPQVVTEIHTYVLGDSDSKNDARAMCFLEAKRKMLEKAGTLVMSHTQAESGVLTKDEINSYTAALIKVENTKERWLFNKSGSMVVVMTVKGVLDIEDINRRLDGLSKKEAAVGSRVCERQSLPEHINVFEKPIEVEFPDGSTLTFSAGIRESEAKKISQYYWKLRNKK